MFVQVMLQYGLMITVGMLSVRVEQRIWGSWMAIGISIMPSAAGIGAMSMSL
jgi:hypothetical protein